MAWKPIHPYENASKVAINTPPSAGTLSCLKKKKSTIKLISFEEQGFSRTKRAKQSQRESVSVLRTASQPNITVAILQEATHTPYTHTPSQTIRMHTQYLTGESFHSPLLKPQATCSPQQTEHDLPFSCSLWLCVSTQSVFGRTHVLADVCVPVHICVVVPTKH